MLPDQEETGGLFQNPKVVFGFILFLVIAGVGMAGYRFANGIRGGFVPAGNSGNVSSQNLGLAENESSDALRNKDTDTDGLSDYDELYQYKTSPYLKDTDSDGTEDKAEIDSEKDPNCPEGKVCKQFVPPASEAVNAFVDTGDLGALQESLGLDSNTLSGAGSQEIVDLSGESDGSENISLDTSNTTNTSNTLDLQNLTAPDIRKLLLDSGKMTKEQLDAVNDETLLNAYREVIAKQ